MQGESFIMLLHYDDGLKVETLETKSHLDFQYVCKIDPGIYA